MSDFKNILAVIAVFIGVVSYIPYLRDIYLNKTNPHAFSWGMWGLLTGIAFAAQLSEGAGAGAWVTGFTAAACFFIALIALIKGSRTFPKIDWLFLASSLVALFLWWLSNNPLLAVILITITDAASFAPTFRKTWKLPNQETASTYALSAIKFILAIAALDSFVVVNWLYPASLVLMNGAFVIMLFARQQYLERSTKNNAMKKTAQ